VTLRLRPAEAVPGCADSSTRFRTYSTLVWQTSLFAPPAACTPESAVTHSLGEPACYRPPGAPVAVGLTVALHALWIAFQPADLNLDTKSVVRVILLGAYLGAVSWLASWIRR